MAHMNGHHRAETTPQADLLQLEQRYHTAWEALQKGELQSAADGAQAIIQEVENYAPAYYLMAEIFRRVGNYASAMKFSELAMKFDPQQADYAFQKGQIAFGLKAWDAAKASFQRVLELAPDRLLALILLADVYASEGDFTQAYATFDKARAIEDGPLLDEHLGMTYMMDHKPDQAESCFRRLLDRNPQHAMGAMQLGKILHEKQSYEDAEAYLLRAIATNPQLFEALILLAKNAQQKGDLHSASEFAQRATQVKPEHFVAWFTLGDVLRQQSRLVDAEAALRKAHALLPDDILTLTYLVSVLVPQQKTAQALELVNEGLSREAGNGYLQHMQNALTGTESATAPEGYVAELFDEYAEKFDHHLQDLLHYNTPRVMAEALQQVMHQQQDKRKELSLLDLGCGTGLGAEAFAAITRHRVGVDLSPKMIEQARKKSLYDTLAVDDVVRYMQHSKEHFDLVSMVDVLVYIGDLAPGFEAAAQVLHPQGYFAVSVEKADDAERFALRTTGRYAHAASYVETLAAQHAFSLCHKSETILRKEAGADMTGYIYIFQKA